MHTAHGSFETPAFIPLATRGSVRSLSVTDVEAIGFGLVLGNTFHLALAPGDERIGALGGLHGFMGWKRSIVTDSGGFQVFSLAHGGVADEVKGRRRPSQGRGRILEIAERGVRFRSYVDGSERFMGPEESMAVQARLGSDLALVFDECTPFHAGYEYTARSTERTHRWLDRCLGWHERHGSRRQAVLGIVQGGVHPELRQASAERISSADVDAVAIGGTLGRDKAEMHAVVELTAPMLPEPTFKHLLGIGEPDDLMAGIAAGIDVFDCAVPTRLARHGMALAPLPESRYRLNVRLAGMARDEAPLVEDCPCEACRNHTRAYLHYLARQSEPTGMRLMTLHNLTFLEQLVRGAREAIRGGRFAAYRRLIESGKSPWAAAAATS